MASEQHRVLVIGGGFGGLSATRALAGADVQMTLVDRTNHHLFQPLLYQVAAGILPPGLIAPALRQVVRTASRTCGCCWPTSRTLTWTGGRCACEEPDGRFVDLPYDTLVVAAGATHSYFGKDRVRAVCARDEDDGRLPVHT